MAGWGWLGLPAGIQCGEQSGEYGRVALRYIEPSCLTWNGPFKPVLSTMRSLDGNAERHHNRRLYGAVGAMSCRQLRPCEGSFGSVRPERND